MTYTNWWAPLMIWYRSSVITQIGWNSWHRLLDESMSEGAYTQWFMSEGAYTQWCLSEGAYTQSSWQPNLNHSLWAYNKDSEVLLMRQCMSVYVMSVYVMSCHVVYDMSCQCMSVMTQCMTIHDIDYLINYSPRNMLCVSMCVYVWVCVCMCEYVSWHMMPTHDTRYV